jgi:undecaprenyl diphosphate synthase
MSKQDPQKSNHLPKHIAVIMDGNGRWAKASGKPRHTGHRAGVKATRKIVEAAAERGVNALTLFAFSSENWSRPKEEVSSLMTLFVEVLQREVDALHKNNVRLKFIGAKEQLSGRLQKRLASSERQTENNTGMSLTLAVAYGGRWDITHAVRAIVAKVAKNEMNAADITEKEIAANLSLAGMDPPDLLIRTGGERRISNFLLWDMAYSELYFTDTLWPEFGAEDLDLAIDFFSSRERRFGRTGEQLDSKAQSQKSEVRVDD